MEHGIWSEIKRVISNPNLKEYNEAEVFVSSIDGGGVDVHLKRINDPSIKDHFHFSTKYKQPQTIVDKLKKQGIKVINKS